MKIEPENPFPFADAGNVPIDPLSEAGGGRFVSGDPKGDRLRVRYFLRLSDRTVVGDVHFGAGVEGPPGHAHGGSIAAVLDEAMGVAAWYSGHRSVAAQLTTNFRRMLPLGTTAFFETQLGEAAGRKLSVTSRLVDPRGELLADATALFVALSPERLEELALRRG